MKKISQCVVISAACAGLMVAPVAQAAPTIPDNLPVFPHSQVQENIKVTVTDEAGNPVTGPVRRGDVLVVHGEGFDPGANRGGFIFPIPPGIPNGVFVLYSGFPENWKLSAGAPAAARKHPHDRMAWVMPDSSLAASPTFPIDLRRVLSRVAQPMSPAGTFTARITVDPPAHPAGDHYGVYLYPGAGSINPAEELFIPIPFDPRPGPNTPKPSPDLLVDATAMNAITGAVRGGVAAKDGAAKQDKTVSFSKLPDQGDGVIRYEGTVLLKAKFGALETAIANPWVRPMGNGTYSVTADVSTGIGESTDRMQRLEVGQISGITGTQVLRQGPLEIGTLTFAK